MNEIVELKIYGDNVIQKIKSGMASIQSGYTNNRIEDVLGIRYKSITNTKRGKIYTDDGLFENIESGDEEKIIIELTNGAIVSIIPQYEKQNVIFDFNANSKDNLVAIRETILNFFDVEYGDK